MFGLVLFYSFDHYIHSSVQFSSAGVNNKKTSPLSHQQRCTFRPCPYPKLDPDASAARYPSQTSTIPYHTTRYVQFSSVQLELIRKLCPLAANSVALLDSLRSVQFSSVRTIMVWYGMVDVCEGAPVAVGGWVLADRHSLAPSAVNSLHRATISLIIYHYMQSSCTAKGRGTIVITEGANSKSHAPLAVWLKPIYSYKECGEDLNRNPAEVKINKNENTGVVECGSRQQRFALRVKTHCVQFSSLMYWVLFYVSWVIIFKVH